MSTGSSTNGRTDTRNRVHSTRTGQQPSKGWNRVEERCGGAVRVADIDMSTRVDIAITITTAAVLQSGTEERVDRAAQQTAERTERHRCPLRRRRTAVEETTGEPERETHQEATQRTTHGADQRDRTVRTCTWIETSVCRSVIRS